MAGIITLPMRTESASAEPDMPTKISEERMLVWESPPRIQDRQGLRGRHQSGGGAALVHELAGHQVKRDRDQNA